MIATTEEIKDILEITDTLISDGSGSLVSYQWYKINVNTTGDFTNIGASANTVGTIFQATGTTPTAWGDGVLLLYTLDVEIPKLIPRLTQWIASYTGNDFTTVKVFDEYFNSSLDKNGYRNNTFSFTADTISDSESGLDFLLFNDLKIYGKTKNNKYYTVNTQTTGSIIIEETFTVEDTDEYLTIFGVEFPDDLALAISYMVSDILIEDDPKEGHAIESESIGDYSYKLSSSAVKFNYSNFNNTSISILNKYLKAQVN